MPIECSRQSICRDLAAAPVRDAATARDVAAQYSMKRVDLHLFFSERASHDIFVPFNCLSINEV